MSTRNKLLPSKKRGRRGFTLVETVIALGIVAFAMVGILGMVPLGLSHFREAVNTTAESQIVQSLSNDLLLANYADLQSNYGSGTNTNYYNDEGHLLDGAAKAAAAFEVKFVLVDLQAPNVESSAGQTVRIEAKKLNSGQAAKKYSFVLPKS